MTPEERLASSYLRETLATMDDFLTRMGQLRQGLVNKLMQEFPQDEEHTQ